MSSILSQLHYYFYQEWVGCISKTISSQKLQVGHKAVKVSTNEGTSSWCLLQGLMFHDVNRLFLFKS